MKRELVFLIIISMIATACQTPSPEPETSQPTPTETALEAATSTRSPSDTPDPTIANIQDYQVIQQGNDAQAFKLQTAPSSELADNHIGLWFENLDRFSDTNFVIENGFKWVRLGTPSGTGQVGWPVTEANLLPGVDEAITEYDEKGVQIVQVLSYAAGLPGVVDEFSQAQIDQLLGYTDFMVTHFNDRIEYFEIWNEFGHKEKIETYTDLINQSYDLIKSINPETGAVAGSVPGDWLLGEPDYGEYWRFVMSIDTMNALIDSMDFDQTPIEGLSWHPIYDNIPTDPYYQDIPEMIRGIQERAESRGFTGEYFADEILWHTYNEEGYTNGPPVPKTISAVYYLRTITEHRGLDVNITINTFFQVPLMDPIKNLNNILAGAEPTEAIAVSLETSEEVQYIRQYTFQLPDGDLLVAVWRNGETNFYDAGVLYTLTIPGVSVSNATGINSYYGFEQELITAYENNTLIIRDLLMKDYPIFIRLDVENS